MPGRIWVAPMAEADALANIRFVIRKLMIATSY